MGAYCVCGIILYKLFTEIVFDMGGDSPDTRISDEPLRDSESRDEEDLSSHLSDDRTDDYDTDTHVHLHEKEEIRRPSGDHLDYDIQQFEILDTAGDQENVDSASGSAEPLEDFSLEGTLMSVIMLPLSSDVS